MEFHWFRSVHFKVKGALKIFPNLRLMMVSAQNCHLINFDGVTLVLAKFCLQSAAEFRAGLEVSLLRNAIEILF